MTLQESFPNQRGSPVQPMPLKIQMDRTIASMFMLKLMQLNSQKLRTEQMSKIQRIRRSKLLLKSR
jgi:hypothetical protein